ncbi:MAG TPA: hypothetical protein VGO11_15225 [Chthoniobacteraceae bacterium]|jgi:hypothetical protein|nr:hypothetical protein [Chthoniobacteraceae bacterium]
MNFQAALVATIALSCSTLLTAAEPALPPIPAVLEPLQAKVANGWYAYKGGLYLNFRAEQPLTEEQWKAIAGLGAKGIGTGGKGINDETVARLATMNLEALAFDGAEGLTEGCFPHLAKMKSLQRLSMGHMLQKGITGKGLALLKDLPALEALTLAGSATGNDAVQAVGELTQLTQFSNWHTRQTDPRAPYLLKLTNLKKLKLGRSNDRVEGRNRLALTDETLVTIAQLKSLEELELEESRLTIPAILQLKALPKLKTLSLRNCLDVPSEDVEKLRKELPGVAIQWKPTTEKEREFLNGMLK